MQLNRNRHSNYRLRYHLIIVTQYGNPAIDRKINERLKEITKRVFEEKWKCRVVNVKTGRNHIHVIFEGTPKTQLTKLINNFKTVSSRLIRKEFKEHLSQFYWKNHFWSPSYCLLSLGNISIETIKEYLKSQIVNNFH